MLHVQRTAFGYHVGAADLAVGRRDTVGPVVGLRLVGRCDTVGARVGYLDDGITVGARVGVRDGDKDCPGTDGSNVGAADGASDRALRTLLLNVSAKTTFPLGMSTNTPLGPRKVALVAGPALSVPNLLDVDDEPMTVVITAAGAVWTKLTLLSLTTNVARRTRLFSKSVNHTTRVPRPAAMPESSTKSDVGTLSCAFSGEQLSANPARPVPINVYIMPDVADTYRTRWL